MATGFDLCEVAIYFGPRSNVVKLGQAKLYKLKFKDFRVDHIFLDLVSITISGRNLVAIRDCHCFTSFSDNVFQYLVVYLEDKGMGTLRFFYFQKFLFFETLSLFLAEDSFRDPTFGYKNGHFKNPKICNLENFQFLRILSFLKYGCKFGYPLARWGWGFVYVRFQAVLGLVQGQSNECVNNNIWSFCHWSHFHILIIKYNMGVKFCGLFLSLCLFYILCYFGAHSYGYFSYSYVCYVY